MSEYLLMSMLCNAGYDPLAASRAIHALQDRHQADDDQADDFDGPGWDDSSTWELGPAPPEPPTFEPSEEDEAWVAGLPTPEDEDWLAGLDVEEAAKYSAWQDMLELAHRITDEDVARMNCAG